jgi:serine/threonine protein kinase
VDESQQSQARCVIKQFFPQHQGTNSVQKATELFRQEATRLEVLGKHRQIPELLAYFEQDDHQYLVQEFIDGENLAQELAQKGPFKETEIRQLLQSLLPVLQFVHSHRMIHRDIKPENIIRCRRDNRLVLVDFGAAKFATETMLGRTGTVIGSAAYIAPEQVKGKAIFASDLYSLGITCIHLLTQIPPFDLSDTSEDTWVWRHYLRTPVSNELGSILDKMLESATKRRYQSVDEVLKDLNARSLPTGKARFKKRWLVAGSVLLLGWAGVRYLTYPVTQQVAQQPESQSQQRSLPAPKQPGLFGTINGQQQLFPLKHTEVMAKVSGNVSRVEVTQTFENPFKDPLEAVYVFPLPGKQNTIPNKDLIVRYQVAGNETQSTVLAQADERGGHFATYLIPAVQYQSNEIVPKDVVFLMDTSGSQSGSAIAQSKELMRRFINGLNPNDTFTIIDFASTTTQLSSTPLQNTPPNRQKALNYINRLDANGGSELMNGIQKVLSFPPAPEGRLRSVVLITDGLIGDDKEVIAEVQKKLKRGNRLYSFGVGSSVNRFLIDRIAEEGRGTSEVLPPSEPGQKVAEKFFQQINNPVLTNIEVTWEGSGKPPEIYPLKPADLFANQPLVLFGRKGDSSKGTLRITGIAAGGKRYEKSLPIDFEGGGNEAIAQLWGRARIKELMDQMFGGETSSGVKAVTDTALAYRLLSQYTAFVAVTEQVRVDPNGKRQRVQVPVETPEGMGAENTADGSASVPEPSLILGNIMALLLFWMYFAGMRRKGLKSVVPRK